jgi:hypothetical protein
VTYQAVCWRCGEVVDVIEGYTTCDCFVRVGFPVLSGAPVLPAGGNVLLPAGVGVSRGSAEDLA